MVLTTEHNQNNILSDAPPYASAIALTRTMNPSAASVLTNVPYLKDRRSASLLSTTSGRFGSLVRLQISFFWKMSVR